MAADHDDVLRPNFQFHCLVSADVPGDTHHADLPMAVRSAGVNAYVGFSGGFAERRCRYERISFFDYCLFSAVCL